MTEQWFWQTQGETYGPLSTDELESLVARGRVQDEDLIRLDGTDEWLPAAQVKEMFAGEGAATGDTAADAAARVLTRAAEINEERKAEAPGKLPFSWRALLPSGRISLGGLVGAGLGLTEFLLARLWWVVGRKSFLAACVLVLVAVILRNVEWTDTRTAAARERLAETWDRMQSLRRREAGDAEWDELQRETAAWLEPTLKELGEASVRNQAGLNSWRSSSLRQALAQQQLVSAGWILKERLAQPPSRDSEERPRERVIKDARGRAIPPPRMMQAGPPDEQFAQRMNLAEAYLTGQIDVSGPTGGEPVNAAVDPVMAGIVVADVALVAGAVVWWWKRRRSREVSHAV